MGTCMFNKISVEESVKEYQCCVLFWTTSIIRDLFTVVREERRHTYSCGGSFYLTF